MGTTFSPASSTTATNRPRPLRYPSTVNHSPTTPALFQAAVPLHLVCMRMKFSLTLWAAAAAFGLTSAGPVAQATCNADSCARAITGATLPVASRSSRLADCSSFLSFTVDPSIPVITKTVTPTSTVTVFTTTVVETRSVISGSAWPTTINSEVYETGYDKRAARYAGAPASTISPTALPAYATGACSDSARFSSACSCAGVTARYTSYAGGTIETFVTAPAEATITQFAATTYTEDVFYTTTFATPLVDDIPCGQLWQLVNDQPAFKVVCEAQGTNPGTLADTVKDTDWSNCAVSAFDKGAYTFEFDITEKACYIYGGDLASNVTTPRSNYVYNYLY